MTKTEIQVLSFLLGRKAGGVITSGGGALRDVIGGRAHKVCRELESHGLGKVEELENGYAFIFRSTDLLQKESAL